MKPVKTLSWIASMLLAFLGLAFGTDVASYTPYIAASIVIASTMD